MIKYSKLTISLDTAAIQSETVRIKTNTKWIAHFNKVYYEGGWDVLPLRSPGGRDDRIIPDLMNEDEYKDTLLMELFPSVQKLVSGLQCPVMSVRLLNLKPGAVIKPHRDMELCFEKGEARIHFPIFTNSQVRFFVDDDLVEMKEGESWYINANRMHSVSNLGQADRIHLVIDCKVNDWLTDIFERSEKVLVKEEDSIYGSETIPVKEDPDYELKVISELRLQNTETSNRLADELLDKIKSSKQPKDNT